MIIRRTQPEPKRQSEHARCGVVFEKLFQTEDGTSIGCDIYRTLLGDDQDTHDNCLGENFNQLLYTIRIDWFRNVSLERSSKEFYNHTYILWLYLVVARVSEVFDTIDPKGKNELLQRKRRSLKAFDEINLWAKFIKHPKEFIFAHWPEASCEGRVHNRSRTNAVRINTAYLKEHYVSDDAKRPVELKNNTDVVVEYPALPRLTEGFVKDFCAFRDFICKNEMVAEELRKDTNVPLQRTLTLMRTRA